MKDPTCPPPSVIDPRRMRDVLGHFASGLTVIAAISDGAPVGFTCQSFSSLSLDPPLVLFAPSRTSTTWPLLRAAGAFCITVLGAGHAALSTTFAKPGADRFSGVEWSTSPAGHPLLHGAAAWIDATLHAEYDGGDHTIVTAGVVGLGSDGSRDPLLFHRGAYTRSAPIG